MGTETGDRRNVSRLFGEWKLVNVPSVPSFSAPCIIRISELESFSFL